MLAVHYLNNALHKEWAKARGFTLTQESKTHVEYHIPYTCPQLTEDNKCKLHGLGKPYVCVMFPQPIGLEEIGLSDDKMLPKECAYREEK